MNAIIQCSKIVIFLSISLLNSPPGYADEDRRPDVSYIKQVDLASVLRESRDRVLAGDTDRARTLLAEGIFHEKYSGYWHLEFGSRLMQAAFLAQESGDERGAKKLAEFALKELAEAAKSEPEDTRLVANTISLQAVITERVTGDTTAALALQKEALKKNPENIQALERLSLLTGSD